MRDLTRKQFVAAMKRYGWRKVEFDLLGADYWERNGLQMASVNYPTRRAALATFVKTAVEQDEEGGDGTTKTES